MAKEGFELTGFTEYEMVTKDAEGEAHVHQLEARRYAKEPDESALQFITQAPPNIIKPSRRVRPTRLGSLTVALADMHIGYRGEETFHDERAMALGQVAIRELLPERIIFLGDGLDLAPFSKYEQRPDWQQTTQRSLDRYSGYIAEARANSPNSEVVIKYGNHEARFERSIRKFNAELSGLTRARAAGALGVLSLEFLLNLDGLDVQVVSGYPNSEYWLNDRLKAIHGNTVNSSGSTVARVIGREAVSVIMGHVHRLELQYRTIPTKNGNRQIWAATPGTLARIDSAVPDANYTTDSHNRTVLKAKNWQQGILIVEHGKTADNPTLAHINDGEVTIWDKKYKLPK